MSSQQGPDNDVYIQPSPILRPAFSSSAVVAAIVILILVVFLILLLHLYARWFWNRSGLLPRRGLAIALRPAATAAGLDAATIAQLPTFTYAAAAASHLQECAVCLSDFQENEKGRLLPSCKHAFHTDCIDMWFFSHSTCPLCRTVVLPAAAHDQSLQPDGPDAPPNAEENPASPHEPPPPIPSTVNSPARPRARALPQITLNIPPIDGAVALTITTPRRHTLSAGCIPQEDQGACSSQQTVVRSPGLSASLKRILSRKSSRTRDEASPAWIEIMES